MAPRTSALQRKYRLGTGRQTGARYGRGPMFQTTQYTRVPSSIPFRSQTSRVAASQAFMGSGRRTGKSEVKVFDTAANNAATNWASYPVPVNATGYVQLVGAVQQGASINQRIANEIQMLSVYVNGQFVVTGNANTQMDYARIMLVYDRQPATTAGTVPGISEILQSTDQAGTNTTTSHSGMNVVNRKRFLVLMDERFSLPGVLATASEPSIAQDYKIKRYIKLRSLETEFKGTASPMTVGNVASGAYYFVTIGAEASGGESFSFAPELRWSYQD